MKENRRILGDPRIRVQVPTTYNEELWPPHGVRVAPAWLALGIIVLISLAAWAVVVALGWASMLLWATVLPPS